MTRKRTADAAACDDHNNAKLQRVTHALENVTREGAMFKSGATERFPPPAIAFKGDGEKELLLPLWADDVQKIKARGVIYSVKGERWEVAGGQLESRNPQWRAFLEETIFAMRPTLGIAPTADVTITLHKLVLAETGTRLNARDEGEVRGDGVFGTLLVVLPGAFEGGDFVVPQPPWFGRDTDDEGDEEDGDEGKEDGMNRGEETTTWRPRWRSSSYGLSYAVFYNHCEVVAEPVTSGAALCLMYDLVTTTPSDVPLFAGPHVVQRSVDLALTGFFEVAPSPLAKRFKISPDAWRSINEFAAERHFAYFVDADCFDSLYCSDRVIAQTLAAFCAQSAGEFVLYHTSALRSRSRAFPSPSSWNVDDDDTDQNHATEEDIRVLLEGPWIKYGESAASAYPPIILRPRGEVAPSGYMIPFRPQRVEPATRERVKKLYGDTGDIHVSPGYSLVVLPTSIEARQMAKLPMEDALGRLRGLLSESRDSAREYARRMIHYRPDWSVSPRDMKSFEAFVEIVVEINDLQLFKYLLVTVNLTTSVQYDSLSSGVKKFSWHACTDTLVKKVRSSSTLCSRVNLINSVFEEGVGAAEIDPLLDALLSLDPYTDVVGAGLQDSITASDNSLQVGDFVHLLFIAHLVSRDKILQLVSVKCAQLMMRVVGPALLEIMADYEELPEIRAALHHVWDLFQPMIPEIRNEKFATLRIPEHCATCTNLQTFLASPATEATVQVADASEAAHMRTVLENVNTQSAFVRTERVDDTTVRISKKRGMGIDMFRVGPDYYAKRLEKRMRDCLFPNTVATSDEPGIILVDDSD